MTLQMRCMTPSIMAGSRHDATAVRRIGRSSAESASTTVECAAQIGCHASLAGFGINVLQRYLAWPSCACVVEQESKPPNSRFDPVKTSRNAPRVSDVHGQRMGHLNNTRRQRFSVSGLRPAISTWYPSCARPFETASPIPLLVP